MKKLLFSVGIVAMMSLVVSCDQHDTTSPDTAGSMPYNQPNTGVDTSRAGSNQNLSPNMSNDRTNKDSGVVMDSTNNQ